MSNDTDWAEWSREAVRQMQDRNHAYVDRYGLGDASYQWHIDCASMTFRTDGREVTADLCMIGSVADDVGTFLWSWANESIPDIATRDIEQVRAFGEQHDLTLLVTPEWPGGHADGLEMAAIAGRILDAEGVWIEKDQNGSQFFALSNFREV